MTKDDAFEILKGIHLSDLYYVLGDKGVCLDGDFTPEELKALVFVMEHKMSSEMDSMIREFFERIRDETM